ncbi:MAG TPA: hypothetical protein DEF42_13035 [Desulfosporosinus sp.]|nr:hypothetical protein [Desulfosporosinus sp.]
MKENNYIEERNYEKELSKKPKLGLRLLMKEKGREKLEDKEMKQLKTKFEKLLKEIVNKCQEG